MVIFTDKPTLSRILSARSQSTGCTVLFVQDLFKTYLGSKVDWVAQHRKDTEHRYHSPEAYIIWNQKSLWVSDVAVENPYRSTHYFWADSGQFRDEAFLSTYVTRGEKWITSHTFIPHCQMAFLAVEMFTEKEVGTKLQGRSPPLDPTLVRLGGGNFGGDSCAVENWRNIFLEEMEWYIENGAFVGKDQPMYSSACITHKNSCFLVDGSKVSEIKDIWFALQPVFHGVTVPVPQYVFAAEALEVEIKPLHLLPS